MENVKKPPEKLKFEIQEKRNDRDFSMEVVRNIAEKTGEFYNGLIDAYLTVQTSEELQQAIDILINGLPESLKKNYQEGLNIFQEELRENHALLEQHRGDEVRYLLGAVLASKNKNPEEIEKIFKQINDNAKFIEPAPGVAMIQVEKKFFQLLKEHDIVPGEGHAINFGSDNRGEPSFLIVQRLSLEKSMAEDTELAKRNNSVRHEFHHFIWNFLERTDNYLRKVLESSPEQAKAFSYFRNEVAAYIIEGRRVGSIEPEFLTYTDDDEIVTIATDTRDFVTICIDVVQQLGIDSQIFLYASMSSRNFAELKDAFTLLTPLENVDQQSVAALYTTWSRNYRALSKIIDLLERKNIVISASIIEEFGLSRMMSFDTTSMGGIFYEIKKLQKFAGVFTKGSIDEQRLVEQVAHVKLPLPKETVDCILKLPLEQLNDIPLGRSGEEFLNLVISFWSIHEESTRDTYKQIINSSPTMREAFHNIRDNIIKEGSESYRTEFNPTDETKKQQIESEIQKRAKLIMEL